MKTDTKPIGAVRLTPCRYGLSNLPFRGPLRPTDGRFIACLGGSETFAKFVPTPYPDLLETAVGEVCVNLGCQAAGPDVFLRDTAVQSLCHDAVATVLELNGAVNLSNAFYKVHPRRNDRFIAPTDKLVALFPEVDFAEIAFTGHLIEALRAADADRFDVVRQHLQQTWVRRTKVLIGQSAGPVILLWLPQVAPALVTAGMVATVEQSAAATVQVTAAPGELDGMAFAPLERLSALRMLGHAAHGDIAKALRGPLCALLC
ncbi:DUF6473 family protein [Thalassorhabdomicrobium marinisediminis]|uniref:DUF6473 family protein n=1 Tax=Thalassorhabdomicrobium marinisediminis TaxID=2170577 RepID=UPI00249317F1|nr:DUF6473 family protein [Thalassorhabdomicrobium marinisediminis]